jgi:hypothetical protein
MFEDMRIVHHARIPLANKFRRRAHAPHACRVTTRSSKSCDVTILWVLIKNDPLFWGPKKGGVSGLRRHAQRASPSADSLFFRAPPPFNQPLMYIWGGGQKPGFWPFPQNTHF